MANYSSRATATAQHFRSCSYNQRREVTLFRSLKDVLGQGMGRDVVTTELHQKSYVTFPKGRQNGRAQPKCELADVLILSYPANKPHETRLTLNQAKVWRNGAPVSGLRHGADLKFRANLEQWDLLANRPRFLSMHGKGSRFPLDLLSSASCGAIGSFGVFFHTNNGWDLSYAIADCLEPINDNELATGTLRYTNVVNHVCYSLRGDAEPFCTNLENFLGALDDGMIGVRVHDGRSDRVKYADYWRWLSAVIAEVERDNPNSELPGEIRRGLDLPPISDDEAGQPSAAVRLGARAVVIVRGGRQDR